MSSTELKAVLDMLPDQHAIVAVAVKGDEVRVTTSQGDWEWLFVFGKDVEGAYKLWRRVPMK